MRDMKGNKKSSDVYVSRKTRENVSMLLIGVGALVTKENEKAKALNAFFTSSLSVRQAFRSLRPLRAVGMPRARMRIRLGII